MNKFFTALLLATTVCTIGAAHATQMIDGSNPDDVINIAKGFGSATLDKDSKGDPRINGRINGQSYMILFYGCTKNKDCREIQFNAYWAGERVSLEDINTWNRDKKYGKAFLDQDNDPFLQMTVNLDKGVSYSNLEDTFDYWSRVLPAFKKAYIKD